MADFRSRHSALFSMTSAGFAEIAHGWMWWATFAVTLRAGNGPVIAYKAAQRACTRLYE